MFASRIPLSPSDERVITSLCAGARFLSIGLSITAALLVLAGAFQFFAVPHSFRGGASQTIMVLGLLGAAVATILAQALFLRDAHRSLMFVVTTDGADQAHLMASLAKLKRVFVIEVVLGALAVLGATWGMLT